MKNGYNWEKKELLEIEELKFEIEETRKEIEPTFLTTYDRVSKIVSRPPYMAPITDRTGCHFTGIQ